MSAAEKIDSVEEISQYSTFQIGERLYGIDVMKVQEIVRPMNMTPVPLSQTYVRGLINLRGQIATAIGLRELFKIQGDKPNEQMNVVCNFGGILLSLLVDKIGDVVEVEKENYEPSPDTIPNDIKKYMNGVYKTPGQILSIIDIEKIANVLNEEIKK